VLDFPEFGCQRLGKSRIWADSSLLASVDPEILADPDQLFGRTDCKLFKDEQKVKVGRVVLDINGVSTGVYLKRYNSFSLRYRVASLVVVSRALKSFRGTEILSRAGISTATPLAVIEFRSGGMLDSSFFLSREVPLAKTVDAYWRENLTPLAGVERFRSRRKFLAALAALVVDLHERRIYHNDLKDANILVKDSSSGVRFSLLDVEGVRRCWYLSRRRRVKNVVQLNRTLGKFLSRTGKLFFLNSYLRRRSNEKRTKRRWIVDILDATRSAIRRSLSKTEQPGSRG
jgi:serine/threonine protein kinase